MLFFVTTARARRQTRSIIIMQTCVRGTLHSVPGTFCMGLRNIGISVTFSMLTQITREWILLGLSEGSVGGTNSGIYGLI